MDKWKKQLFEQKSLSCVYKESNNCIKASNFNENVWIIAFVIIFVFLISNVFCQACLIPHLKLWGIILSLSESVFSYTTGILGFLIAGFAIFTSITKPIIFINLAKVPHDNGQINELQFVFFNFMTAFINFLGLMIFSFILLAIGKIIENLNGGISNALTNNIYLITSIYMCFILFSTWIASSFLKLKSFIWNSYQSIILAITVEDELLKIEKEKEDKVKLEEEKKSQKQPKHKD